MRSAIRRALMLAGYEVLLAADGEEGLRKAGTAMPDAIVLDLGLPVIDGMEVCRRLRRDGNRTPILMLTARDAVDDRVDGLGSRRRRLPGQALRRPRAAGATESDHAPASRRRQQALRFGDLELDADAHAARVGEQSIELTRTEYQLLELLMLNPRRVLTSELIYDRVWGYDVPAEREHAEGLHRIPPAQAGSGRWSAAHPHRARHRVRAPRAMSLRRRITAAVALAVAGVAVLLAVAGYVSTKIGADQPGPAGAVATLAVVHRGRNRPRRVSQRRRPKIGLRARWRTGGVLITGRAGRTIVVDADVIASARRGAAVFSVSLPGWSGRHRRREAATAAGHTPGAGHRQDRTRKSLFRDIRPWCPRGGPRLRRSTRIARRTRSRCR